MNLFEIQPPECRKQLTFETSKITTKSKVFKRILNFDPTSLYEKINQSKKLNPFKRFCKIEFSILFPKIEGVCGCGCEQKLTGRRSRWASSDCQRFATSVYHIITGKATFLRKLRKIIIGGYFCEICFKDKVDLELDHLIPIKHGGGGSWLSNYQFKCKACHRIKTNNDFGFQPKK